MESNRPQQDFDLVALDAAHDEAVLALSGEAALQVNPEGVRRGNHSWGLVALGSQGQVLGFVTGWVVGDEAELHDVAVSSKMRRRGIGSALVDGFLDEARQRGAKAVFLEVSASNESALALYRRRGFRATGRRHGYYVDGQDAILFRCCLRGAD